MPRWSEIEAQAIEVSRALYEAGIEPESWTATDGMTVQGWIVKEGQYGQFDNSDSEPYEWEQGWNVVGAVILSKSGQLYHLDTQRGRSAMKGSFESKEVYSLSDVLYRRQWEVGKSETAFQELSRAMKRYVEFHA